jgi:phasin protein
LERYTAQPVGSARKTVVVTQSSLEYQMSKRKPATAPKHARSPKIAAKAQRANQAVVRSPKDSRPRPVAAGPTESPPKRHNESKQEAPRVENPAAALQDVGKQAMRDNNSNKGFGFSSVAANVQAYQAKLLEMAQANMQFALEFAQRLATVRSPVEIFRVVEEFTSRRTAMFRKHSQELAELTSRR